MWVVDEYFLAPHKNSSADARIRRILKWLDENRVASDIRILTADHKEVTGEMLQRFEDKARAINARHPNRSTRCSIQVCTRLKKCFDLIHDRFAIVDDELWHFGATVGGFHTSVNAASRGWDAVDSGAIKFFELAWDKCKER